MDTRQKLYTTTAHKSAMPGGRLRELSRSPMGGDIDRTTNTTINIRIHLQINTSYISRTEVAVQLSSARLGSPFRIWIIYSICMWPGRAGQQLHMAATQEANPAL